MQKLMLIDALHPEEMRMVITDHKSTIHEFDFTTAAKQQIKGNIYLAKVTRVEPSLQAAFVEYGGGKQGFLPFAEIHPDYYQIPVADRARLLEEEAMAEESDEEEHHASQRQEGGERRDRHRRRGRGRDRNFKRGERGEADKNADSLPQQEGVEAEIVESSEGYSLTLTEMIQEKVIEEKPFSEGEVIENTSEESIPDARIHEAVGTTLPESVTSEKTEEELQAQSANDDEVEYPSAENNSGEEGVTEPTDAAESNAAEAQEVETLSSEDEIERPRRKHFSRRYKIQEVIKRNQIMLVQVIKEERGNKGVSLTSYLSLAGRYCVLMPNSPRGGGVSRKIGTGEDRKRLKSIIDDLELPGGMSVIIRTAGANRTKVEVKRDFDYLVKLWNQIREDTLSSSAPALIYQESDIIKRSIRDVYNNEIEEILVEGEAAYKEAKHFMKMLVPSHAPRVKQFKGNVPLFYHYNVEEQLISMNDPIVKLRSGGYIVMNPTEALISIDVNSGRSTGERNIEETAIKTNIEAAQEIARQLRLRDLAGLIVIDFIDMMDGKNRRNVERVLKDALRSDRAKIQIGRISPFGLLEMSRQRLRPSIAESVSKPCDHCNGTGAVRTDAAVAIQLIRSIEKEVGQQPNIDRFRIFLTPSVTIYLLNQMRDTLQKLEQDYEVTLEMQIDSTLREGNFRLEKIRSKDKEKIKQKELPHKPVIIEETEEELAAAAAFEAAIAAEEAQNQENDTAAKAEKSERPRRRDRNNRNRRGGRNRDDKKPESQNGEVAEIAADGVETSTAPNENQDESGAKEHKPRRRRPVRGHEKKPKPDDLKSAPTQHEPKFASEMAPNIAPNVKAHEPQVTHFTPKPSMPKPAATELAVMADPKPAKPARRGWWQKIME